MDDQEASKDELESTATSSLVEEKMVTIGGENERTEKEKLTNLQ